MDSSVHGYVSLFSRSWRLLGRVRGRRGKGCRPFESRTAVGPRPRGRAPGRPARHCGVPPAPGPVCARPGRSLTAAVGRHDEMDGVAACRHPRGTRLSAGRLPPRLPDVARKTQAEPIPDSGPGQLIGMARNRSWANRHSWARQNRTVSTSAAGTGAAAAQPRRRTSGRCKRGTWHARLSSRTAGVPYAGGAPIGSPDAGWTLPPPAVAVSAFGDGEKLFGQPDPDDPDGGDPGRRESLAGTVASGLARRGGAEPSSRCPDPPAVRSEARGGRSTSPSGSWSGSRAGSFRFPPSSSGLPSPPSRPSNA